MWQALATALILILTIASGAVLGVGRARDRALQEKIRLARAARRALRRNPGRVVIVAVGDYGLKCLEKQLPEMRRTGALDEIALILVLQLDKKLREDFCAFMVAQFPEIRVKALEVDDLQVGGLHSREGVQEAERDWGPKRNALVIEAIMALQVEAVQPAEIWVIDGLGSQTDLGLATADQLTDEFVYARAFVQAIIPDQDPLRSQALAKLEDYPKLAKKDSGKKVVRALLVTDNACGMATNDQANAVLHAVRLSTQLDKGSVDSGYNLLEDGCPADDGGILSIRRVQRRVAVRGVVPRSPGPWAGDGQPAVKSSDLLFETKRLAREIFADSDAAALDLDAFPALPGRRQVLFFLLPATQEQLDAVASELKESLGYAKVNGKNFYERHPNLVLRFARYDVPRTPQADLWCVYLFAPPGQWEDLRGAVAKRSPPPGPNGQQTSRLAETVVSQAAVEATAKPSDGRRAKRMPASGVPPASGGNPRSSNNRSSHTQPPVQSVGG